MKRRLSLVIIRRRSARIKDEVTPPSNLFKNKDDIMFFLFHTLRNLLSPVCISSLSATPPPSSLRLTLYLSTPSICLTSIFFQFTLIYRRGCCTNSAATLCEYKTKGKQRRRKKKRVVRLRERKRVCVCVRRHLDLSHCIFTSSSSTHPALLHLIPPSAPPHRSH